MPENQPNRPSHIICHVKDTNKLTIKEHNLLKDFFALECEETQARLFEHIDREIEFQRAIYMEMLREIGHCTLMQPHTTSGLYDVSLMNTWRRKGSALAQSSSTTSPDRKNTIVSDVRGYQHASSGAQTNVAHG
jgi:hypothetical protein